MSKLQLLVHSTARADASTQIPIFQKGSLFYGDVIKLFPNDFAQITIKGRTITAKLHTPLEVGNQYLLQVEETDPHPRLKVFASRTPLHQSGMTEEGTLQALLKKMGLPTNATYKRLMTFFKAEGFPFSQALLQKSAACLVNHQMEEGLATLKTLLVYDLPIEREVFDSVHSVRSERSFMNQLQTLQQVLQAVPNQSEHMQRIMGQLVMVIESISTSMRALTGQPDMSSTDQFQTNTLPASIIQHIVTSLGFTYEKHAVQFLSGKLSLAEFQIHRETLKPILLTLLNEEIPNVARELAQELLHRITGHQLLLHQEELMQHIFLRLPLPLEMSESNLTVQFQGKKKQGQIDPDFCRILFYLQLKNLHETVIDVHIQNRLLAVTVYNEQPYARLTLKPYEQSLKKRLQLHGYELTSLKWRHTNEQILHKKVPFSFQRFPRQQGVDYRI